MVAGRGAYKRSRAPSTAAEALVCLADQGFLLPVLSLKLADAVGNCYNGTGLCVVRHGDCRQCAKLMGSGALRPQLGAGRSTKLGRPFCFTWCNGHDGSSSASPDPLLLAPDPFSWAHRVQDRAQPGQLHIFFIFTKSWGDAPIAFRYFGTRAVTIE